MLVYLYVSVLYLYVSVLYLYVRYFTTLLAAVQLAM